MKDDDYDLPLEFWIPSKQHYIAGATKLLSKIVASIFIAVKTGLQKYHDICFSRSGVNQLWMLKNSKYLMETLSSRSQCDITLIHLIVLSYIAQFHILY